MRIARVSYGGHVHLARIESDVATLVARESEHPAADVLREVLSSGGDLVTATGTQVPLGDIGLLAPVANPSKFIGVGLNYADHASEANLDLPTIPTLFSKTPNTIVGPGQPIVASPQLSKEVDFEVELAVVIGSTAHDVSTANAEDHILGYTVCNDVSARDVQFADGQWFRGKSFDSFGPLGPVIVTPDAIDVTDCELKTTVNGEVLQEGTTREQIFSPAEIVSFISRYATLTPGDVITTGTPSGVGFARVPQQFLSPGDEVSVSVAGIGTLTNPVLTFEGLSPKKTLPS